MDFISIHKKWREYWAKNGTDKYDPNSKKPKYYHLIMFAYPSGAHLHLGHFFQYSLPDAHVRFKRMCGYNVFNPMGFDAFGLPAENFALRTGTHPRANTVKHMEIMKGQFEKMGVMSDWDWSVTTCFPDYYRWTQWLFVEIYNAGLAYQRLAPVNWCSKCNTVLANEQVAGGLCERCDTQVVRVNKKQWFFRITDFAEELLAGLDGLDWPEKTKTMQRNWIGKSVGAEVAFDDILVFTTRIDTINGATFLVLAPEHPLAVKYITKEQRKACDDYIAAAAKKSDIERLGTEGEKTGVFTGSYVTNPANGERVPVWIADYILSTYGTGAIMAVPAHDERDEGLAKKYNLPIVKVVDGEFEPAKQKMLKQLGNKAKTKITYRLRDWGIGRQRYWGCPIPIVYCDKCGTVAETRLPVILPEIQDFSPKGVAPLASHPEFYECTCPKCGKPAKRECDTMDTFVCSSWYYLRFPDAHSDKEPFSRATATKMLPVDKYTGGAEHACMHLLYARFVAMFLKKRKIIDFSEPFKSLIHPGLILGTDGQKMSKSKGNYTEPSVYEAKYGSDILRLYMAFGFNYTEGGPWNDQTLQATVRFPERIEAAIGNEKAGEIDKELLYVMHSTIKAVRNDLETFSFNTAVARCMELLNAIQKTKGGTREAVRTLVLLTAPMFPHIAEEFWEMTGGKPSVFDQPFPVFDERWLVRDTVEIAVQINSKIVGRIEVPSAAAQPQVEKLCTKFTDGIQVKKAIYITGKLINFIV